MHLITLKQCSRSYSRGFLIFILLLVACIFPYNPAYAEIGIVARVKTSVQDDPSDAGKLWFKIKPGESKSKSLAIFNTSSGSVIVNLSLTAAIRDEDGVIARDLEGKFQGKRYFRFSKNNFPLNGRSTTTVEVIASNPSGEVNESYDFYLEVKARRAGFDVGRAKSGIGVYVPIEANYALPGFLGLGNYSNKDHSFSIEKISGSLNSEGVNSLRVYLKNEGEVPMFFKGSVSLANLEFPELETQPLSFSSKTIPIGQVRFVDIPVTSEIVEGKYKALIRVDNGKVLQSRVLEFNLKFPSPISGLQRLLLLVISLLCGCALFLSIQYIRDPETSLIVKFLTFSRSRRNTKKLTHIPESDSVLDSQVAGNINHVNRTETQVNRSEKSRKKVKRSGKGGVAVEVETLANGRKKATGDSARDKRKASVQKRRQSAKKK